MATGPLTLIEPPLAIVIEPLVMVSDVGKLVDVSALFRFGAFGAVTMVAVSELTGTWAVPPVPPEQVQFAASVQIVDDVPFHVHAEFAASALGATKVAATCIARAATTIATVPRRMRCSTRVALELHDTFALWHTPCLHPARLVNSRARPHGWAETLTPHTAPKKGRRNLGAKAAVGAPAVLAGGEAPKRMADRPEPAAYRPQ